MSTIVLIGVLVGAAIGIGVTALIVIEIVKHSNEWGDPDGEGDPSEITITMLKELKNVDKRCTLRDFMKE